MKLLKSCRDVSIFNDTILLYRMTKSNTCKDMEVFDISNGLTKLVYCKRSYTPHMRYWNPFYTHTGNPISWGSDVDFWQKANDKNVVIFRLDPEEFLLLMISEHI